MIGNICKDIMRGASASKKINIQWSSSPQKTPPGQTLPNWRLLKFSRWDPLKKYCCIVQYTKKQWNVNDEPPDSVSALLLITIEKQYSCANKQQQRAGPDLPVTSIAAFTRQIPHRTEQFSHDFYCFSLYQKNDTIMATTAPIYTKNPIN